MLYNRILEEVEKIKTKYDEHDPYKLCKAMGIILRFEPMGSFKGACKGFFLYHSRKGCITINSELPEQVRKIILVHELGHAILHRDACELKAFHDFALFDNTSRYEYEANVFASEFLIDDSDVLELLEEGLDFSGMAKQLYVPDALLGFKLCSMKEKGYKGIAVPVVGSGGFLRDM
jgi:Zn-dependent peptidase ImmA (M78 family)